MCVEIPRYVTSCFLRNLTLSPKHTNDNPQFNSIFDSTKGYEGEGPPRRRFNKRAPQRRGGNKRDWSDKQRTCRASGREFPYQVEEFKGSDGMIRTFTVTPSDSAFHYTGIFPAGIGVRCAQLGGLYNEYRINRLIVRYKPLSTGTTINQNTTALYMSGAGISTQLAGGFCLDPTVTNLSQSEIVECGGKTFRSDRPFSWTMTKSKWLYTTPVGSSSADVRFVSPGNFFLTQFQSAAIDPAGPIGYLEFDWDVSFRYPLDADDSSLRYASDPMAILRNHISANKRLQEEKRNHSDHSDSPVVIDDDIKVSPQSSTPRLRIQLTNQKGISSGPKNKSTT